MRIASIRRIFSIAGISSEYPTPGCRDIPAPVPYFPHKYGTHSASQIRWLETVPPSPQDVPVIIQTSFDIGLDKPDLNIELVLQFLVGAFPHDVPEQHGDEQADHQHRQGASLSKTPILKLLFAIACPELVRNFSEFEGYLFV